VNTAPLADGFTWRPEASAEGPVTILVTNEDQRIRVFRGGIEIGHAPFTLTDRSRKFTLHVLTMLDSSDAEPIDPATGPPIRRWLMVSGDQQHTISAGQMLALFEIAPDFLRNLATVVGPGTTLVVTQPAAHGSPGTTLTNDVVAVAAEEPTDKK
jgi:hypothetical protein